MDQRSNEDLSLETQDNNPQLKYYQLGTDAAHILARDSATCFVATDKAHILGCADGQVHLLDFQGHRIASLISHNAAVTALSICKNSDQLICGFDDGNVVIIEIYDGKEVWRSQASSSVSCVAVPLDSTSCVRGVAVGTERGAIVIKRKTWMGIAEQKIGDGEGRIHGALWLACGLLWATDAGISAVPSSGHVRGTPLQSPQLGSRGRCSLVDVGNDLVLAAWPHMVQLLHFHRESTSSPPKLDALHTFEVPYTTLGAAPFGANIALLVKRVPDDLDSGGQGSAEFDTERTAGTSGGDDQPAFDQAASTNGEACVACNDLLQEGEQDRAQAGLVDIADEHPVSCAPSTSSVSADLEERVSGNCSPIDSLGAGIARDGVQSTLIKAGEDTLAPLVIAQPDNEGIPLATQDASPSPSLQSNSAMARYDVEHSPDKEGNCGQQHFKDYQSANVLQLCIFDVRGTQLRQDDLDDHLLGEGGMALPRLVCWYPSRYAPLLSAQKSGEVAGKEQQNAKWWADDDEPLYCIMSEHSLVLGRPCDTDDLVAWLMSAGKYEAAVKATMAAPYVSPLTKSQSSNAFLKYLLETGKFAGAASWAARLLGNDRDAWQHLVFQFDQQEQLPVLGPFVPTESPTLSQPAYSRVASSFLPKAELHSQLLELLQSWPHAVLSNISSELTQAVTDHLAHCPPTQLPDLQRCLAHLHRLQGHHLQALEVWLRIGDPGVFAYINKFHLYVAAARRAVQLMEIDENQAVGLLVQHHEAASAQTVGMELLRAVRAAERRGNADDVHTWRRRLFKYLDALFERERSAPHNFHDEQVDLYAEFAPQKLLAFLQSSKAYHMDCALAVCQRAGLAREQVFILGRMSRASEALQLIICDLKDLPQAIAFVSAQGDDALWDELIALAAANPEFVGELLDQVGGHVDPLRVVRAIPHDIPIPRLNARLAAVIKRFRASIQLKRQCNEIIDADCMMLTSRLVQCSQRPLQHVCLWDADVPEGPWSMYDAVSGECSASAKPQASRGEDSFYLLAGPLV